MSSRQSVSSSFSGSGGRPALYLQRTRTLTFIDESAVQKALHQIDIVCDIVEQLATIDDEYDTSARNRALYAAALISPLWKKPALRALYARLEPSSYPSAMQLLSKLKTNSAHAERAQALILPNFAHVHFRGTNEAQSVFKKSLERLSRRRLPALERTDSAFSEDQYLQWLSTFNQIGLLTRDNLRELVLPCIPNGEPRIGSDLYFFARYPLLQLQSLTCHSELVSRQKNLKFRMALPNLKRLTFIGQCHEEKHRRNTWMDLPVLEHVGFANNQYSLSFLRSAAEQLVPDTSVLSSLSFENATFMKQDSVTNFTTYISPQAALKIFPVQILTHLTIDIQNSSDPLDKFDFASLTSLHVRGQRWKILKGALSPFPIALRMQWLKVVIKPDGEPGQMFETFAKELIDLVSRPPKGRRRPEMLREVNFVLYGKDKLRRAMVYPP